MKKNELFPEVSGTETGGPSKINNSSQNNQC